MTDADAPLERIIVCGGRDYNHRHELDTVLHHLNKRIGPFKIVWHGNAWGADKMAGAWCERNNIKVNAVPAEWKKHGKAAGPKRNQKMLSNGIHAVIAFPGGRGTADMVRRAKKAGVTVFEVGKPND